MKEGALVLLVFATFSQLNVGNFVAQKFKVEGKRLLKPFLILLFIICMLASFLFFKTEHEVIFAISALIGTANGLYCNTIQPYLS